jgi:hypothetical protein
MMDTVILVGMLHGRGYINLTGGHKRTMTWDNICIVRRVSTFWQRPCQGQGALSLPRCYYLGKVRPFALDYVGPLPTSIRGDEHILVAVEYFTKWPIIKAVAKADWDATAKYLSDCPKHPRNASKNNSDSLNWKRYPSQVVVS